MTRNGLRNALLGGLAVVCCGSALAQSSTFSAKDKMFLKNSAEGSMTEIKLSQVALQKSSNDDVKQFAQKMIDDHTKLISDMKPYADQAGVTPPTTLKPAHQALEKKLSALNGDTFDKQYIAAMVKDHKQDLMEFKAEESSTANPDLKNTVSQGEQVVQQHYDMINQIAQKNGVSTPASGQ